MINLSLLKEFAFNRFTNNSFDFHGRSHLADISDEKFKEYKSNMVSKMIQYLMNTACRRR